MRVKLSWGAQSDDNRDTLSIHADNESDSDRFDPTEGELSFRLEGAWYPLVENIPTNT
jgi:uncharacterized protein YbaR (Trm112 family)